jgi:hypothetical protein
LNTGIIENFLTFLTRGRTQIFDFKQRSYDWWKLVELTRYDFQLESILNLFWL